MKRALIGMEIRRFIGKIFLFAIILLIFYGVGSAGIWLYNRIDEGACMLNWSIAGYCVIDSLLLTLLATIGATAAVTLLRTALAELANFVGTMGNLLSKSESEIVALMQQHEQMMQANAGPTMESSAPPAPEPSVEPAPQAPTAPAPPETNDQPGDQAPEFSNPPESKQEGYQGILTCEYTGNPIAGQVVSWDTYSRGDSPWTFKDIVGTLCPHCGKVSDSKAHEASGIRFHAWHGFDKSVCRACNQPTPEPSLVVKLKS